MTKAKPPGPGIVGPLAVKSLMGQGWSASPSAGPQHPALWSVARVREELRDTLATIYISSFQRGSVPR